MKHHFVRRGAVSPAIKRGSFRLFALAASGAAVLALASAALGSSGAKGAGGVGSVRGALAVPAATQSSVFAGWFTTVQGGFKMSATVVLPKLKCGRTQQGIVPAVLGGLGAAVLSAGEFVGCYRGNAHYFPLLDGGGTAKFAAHAGDRVVFSVSVSSTKSEVSVVDKTTRHASRKLRGAGRVGRGGCSAADFPVDNSNTGRLEGVPNFDRLTFSHVVLDGKPLGTASSLTKSNRYSGRTLQIKTSPFASDEETFRTIFKHS